jgi:CHAT domain-containing protein
MGLNMNADIVALTACQTGLGNRTAGEGTMGMGRAFQYAGAKSVLMSLRSVSEVASVNLLKSFFQNIKNGKNKSKALAEARGALASRSHDNLISLRHTTSENFPTRSCFFSPRCNVLT